MTLALNLDRKAQAAAVVHSHGVPHRRIEEWKYSDLKAVLGEAGLGAVVGRPAVRAVEAAPPGTAARELALSPLLPEQTVRADPLPDDGPVLAAP